MDNLSDYVKTSKYFNRVRVKVEDVAPVQHEYCCERMMVLCSEIDGYFFMAEDAEEYDKKSDYFIDLCRERNAHMCAERNEKQDNLHETMDMNGEITLQEFKILPEPCVTGNVLHTTTQELLEASKVNPHIHKLFKEALSE